MTTGRRTFHKIAVAGLLLGPTHVLSSPSEPRLLSCRSNGKGQHFATLFLGDGRILLDVELPARGHGIAVNRAPTQAVVFARRPGDFMIVIDLLALRTQATVTAAVGRQFYGHGVFSLDGDRLYATENAFASGRGMIGVYDCGNGFRMYCPKTV